MATAPAYVQQFLRELPDSWDETKYLVGFPGKYVVLARKAAGVWYLTGINAEAKDKTVSLDLSFIDSHLGTLITDGVSERQFSTRPLDRSKGTRITIKSHGGFVAVFK